MKKTARRGQGIVEYAGALVLAVLIVGVGLVSLPPGAYTLINQILQAIGSFITAQAQQIGQSGG